MLSLSARRHGAQGRKEWRLSGKHWQQHSSEQHDPPKAAPASRANRRFLARSAAATSSLQQWGGGSGMLTACIIMHVHVDRSDAMHCLAELEPAPQTCGPRGLQAHLVDPASLAGAMSGAGAGCWRSTCTQTGRFRCYITMYIPASTSLAVLCRGQVLTCFSLQAATAAGPQLINSCPGPVNRAASAGYGLACASAPNRGRCQDLPPWLRGQKDPPNRGPTAASPLGAAIGLVKRRQY